jgi:serralysin
MTTDTDNSTSSIFDTAKGGLFGGPFDSSGLDSNVRALLMDFRWTTSFGGNQAAKTISYFFPQQASDYTKVDGYPATTQVQSFAALTPAQEAAAKTAFGLVSFYTLLKFVPAASGSAADAAFRFAQFNDGGSESNFPVNNGSYQKSDSREAGDTFLGRNGAPPAAYFGTDAFNTIMHEMGHAFGLKHGHDGSYNGMLAPDVNDNEFSVMTYASYFGADTGGATEARLGSAPQSYMMFDIAALQALYGANFDKAGTTSVYKWDATGQETINGQSAPDTGVSATNKIFSTVWTQGAVATYDFSNFADNQVDDLRPGHWSTFSHAQLADLNSAVPADTPQYKAQGNIYNALLYNGDTRSLIGNIVSGSGNDKITGNQGDNKIVAGAGNDTIDGGGGHDTISGGAGADTIDMSKGSVTLHDTPADMAPDTLVGAQSGDSLDFQGVHASAGQVSIDDTSTKAKVGIGGYTIDMSGDFTDGAFMIDARGQGDDGHTAVTFVDYLPTLREGVGVDTGHINGVANQTFMTGDGSLGFTLDFQSAMSSFANTLGYYKIAADGTISDAHILFGNTLNVAPGTTVNLGTPADGQQIGFFLIQDGAHQFANLPDNLSFVTQGGQVANLDGKQVLFLQSASLGLLSGATIFHSASELNAGDADQVLSGVTADGKDLVIGFEDVANGKGDNDFQDVVFRVHVDHGSVLS